MRIVVLGAGVAGLCGALRLSEAVLGRTLEVLVLEKEPVPGGLLRSTHAERYCWDNGVFAFPAKTSHLVKLLPELFEPIADYACKVWLRNRFYEFPFRAGDLLSEMGLFSLGLSGLDYCRWRVRSGLRLYASNLHDWLCQRMTSPVLRHTELDAYIGKLQGRKARQLSPLLGEHRFQGLSQISKPVKVLKSLFHRDSAPGASGGGVGLVTCPSGIGAISRRLAELCERRGVTIRYGAEVKRIVRKDPARTEVQYETETGADACDAAYVLSTIPLNVLAGVLWPLPTREVLSHAERLFSMDMQLVFFVIRRPVIQHRHFICYSFEQKHLWKRLVARSLADGRSSVVVERTYDPKAGRPQADLAEAVARDLASDLELFDLGDIEIVHTATVRHAYPIYDLGFEDRVSAVAREVRSERLEIAGSQGLFANITTTAAAESGRAAADRILRHGPS
jgi:protoporphyrinogen oxidase